MPRPSQPCAVPRNDLFARERAASEGCEETGAGAVQAHLVLDQPGRDQAKEAAAVQPSQPGLVGELSHSAAEPVTPAQLVGFGVPVQRNESTRLALVISVQRPDVGDGAIVAKLMQEVR